MPQVAHAYLQGLAGFHFKLLAVFPLLLCAELLFPRGQGPSLAARVRSLAFWSVYAFASVAVLLAFRQVLVAADLAPLATLAPFSGLPKPLDAIAAAVVGVCIGDFFFYWLHRFEHRKLWRFHKVHHSVRQMHAFAGFHHVTEEAFRLLFITAPVFFLIGDPAEAYPLVGALAYVQGHYLHSCTRLNLGPLGYLVMDNRFHRIHHSLEARHWDRNFGAVTPLWDVLFGTAYFPKPDEWPQVGLADMDEPRTVAGYLAAPFAAEPLLRAVPEPSPQK
jgi:sterol desaturase/sphingolipid hydroxylase (fatty acid hydroxylase superfamily)